MPHRVSRRRSDSQRSLTLMALLMIFVASVLIAITTLLPFNLMDVDTLSWRYALERVDLRLLNDDNWTDFPRNILLFIPLGMGVSALMSSLGKGERQTTIVVLIFGVGATLMIESFQIFLTDRSPELSDAIANSVGALAGHFILHLMRNSMQLLVEVGSFLSSTRGLLYLLPGVIGVTALMSLGLFYLGTQTGLSNWNTGYHLAIGNELTGNRSWQGNVDEIIVLDRVATAEEIADYLGDVEIPATTIAWAPVAHYCLACTDARQERSGLSPNLVPRTFKTLSTDSVDGGGQESDWLETTEPAATLSRRLADSSEFTIMVALRSAAAKQSGPARIVTLSQDAYNRNFTIGQEGADLVFRLRTPTTGMNGMKPEIRVPDVFLGDGPRRIAVEYAPPKLRIFVDTPANLSEVALAPGIAFIRYLIPNSGWHLSLRRADLTAYRIVFYAFVFIPLLIIVLLTILWMYRVQPVGSARSRRGKESNP